MTTLPKLDKIPFRRHTLLVSAKLNGLHHWTIRAKNTGQTITSGTTWTAWGARRRGTRIVRRIERA